MESEGSSSWSSVKEVEGWLEGSVGWPWFPDSPEIVRESQASLCEVEAILSGILVGSVVRRDGGFRTVRGAGREGNDKGS